MNIFSTIGLRKPKRNKFNLSHDKKLSCQMAALIPILCNEVLPGDTFKVQTEIMMRLAPMIAPVMHRVNVYTHYFFVPNRIIWNEWEDFITGGPAGTSAPVWPTISINDSTKNNFVDKTLSDYLGLPTVSQAAGIAVTALSALPYRAYAEIWNEYYRDQTLSTEFAYSKASGPQAGADLAGLLSLRYRAWEKDYFTSALPWTQRGPSVGLPMSVTYKPTSTVVSTGAGQPVNTDGYLGNTVGTSGQLQYGKTTTSGQGTQLARIENIQSVSDVSINELRKSVRLQEWLEKNARGGARYIEQLMSHFGKAPHDARLQRPEYLTGSVQPIVISEVLNTAGNNPTQDPVGEMSGHGISVGANNGFKKTFEEHGFVIGIMSVLPRTSYQQGIHRMWTRADKLDYAWPEFAQLGEQEIQNRELFYDGTSTNLTTFGYTPRYAEYKYGVSTVHGDFRTTQDFWHLGRKFTSTPPLNENFVMAKPADTKRIFAVTTPTTDDLYVQIHHNISAIRPLPYFGTPTL